MQPHRLKSVDAILPVSKSKHLRRSQQIALWLGVLAVATAGLTACGNDVEDLAQNHTVHGSLWTSFYATVTERYAVPEADVDDDSTGGIAYRLATDVWSVDDKGVAQFLSNTHSQEAAFEGVPETVVVKQIEDSGLAELKNNLARYRVFTWPDTITCDMVECTGDHGTATLQVNLNGENKTVTWPLYATGLPQGLEEMVQEIKDAV